MLLRFLLLIPRLLKNNPTKKGNKLDTNRRGNTHRGAGTVRGAGTIRLEEDGERQLVVKERVESVPPLPRLLRGFVVTAVTDPYDLQTKNSTYCKRPQIQYETLPI